MGLVVSMVMISTLFGAISNVIYTYIYIVTLLITLVTKSHDLLSRPGVL